MLWKKRTKGTQTTGRETGESSSVICFVGVVLGVPATNRSYNPHRTSKERSSLKLDILPNSEFNLSNTNHLLALALVIALLVESIRMWVGLFRARLNREPWLNWCDEPRATWTSMPEVTVVVLVFLMLVVKLDPSPRPEKPDPMTLNDLMMNLVVGGGIAFLLPAILICSHPPALFGIKFRSLVTQAQDGVKGFLLALAPTGILMLAIKGFRNEQNQNALLTLLFSRPGPAMVAAICIMAVVLAPLFEEMMFRVILQGWLMTRLKSNAAIPITAVIFAAIHGITDGIALLPLAFVLGFVFHRRHSYVSVIVIHGLFNATMLTLAMLQ